MFYIVVRWYIWMPKTFKTKNEYHLERKLIFIENIGLRYTYMIHIWQQCNFYDPLKYKLSFGIDKIFIQTLASTKPEDHFSVPS